MRFTTKPCLQAGGRYQHFSVLTRVHVSTAKDSSDPLQHPSQHNLYAIHVPNSCTYLKVLRSSRSSRHWHFLVLQQCIDGGTFAHIRIADKAYNSATFPYKPHKHQKKMHEQGTHPLPQQAQCT